MYIYPMIDQSDCLLCVLVSQIQFIVQNVCKTSQGRYVSMNFSVYSSMSFVTYFDLTKLSFCTFLYTLQYLSRLIRVSLA